MMHRTKIFTRKIYVLGLLATGWFISPWCAAEKTAEVSAPVAAARMQEPGPEARALARSAGLWDVVMTLKVSPGAPPVVTKGLLAERTMIGLFLQEVMKPSGEVTMPDFRRISYLSWSRVEGRWQYVSLDTRMPVGIMPATSFGKEKNGRLEFRFEHWLSWAQGQWWKGG